jgi:hypothetical protein
LVDGRLRRARGRWIGVRARKVTDGPNQYKANPNAIMVPGADRRFIWAHITLHNTQPVARKFNFDRCDLDDGQKAIVPAAIDIDSALITGGVNREPELAPDETITRRLIFPYPENRSPTRLACAPMVIPLPQF